MIIVILESVVVLLNLLILVILENSSELRYKTEPADSPAGAVVYLDSDEFGDSGKSDQYCESS